MTARCTLRHRLVPFLCFLLVVATGCSMPGSAAAAGKGGGPEIQSPYVSGTQLDRPDVLIATPTAPDLITVDVRSVIGDVLYVRLDLDDVRLFLSRSGDRYTATLPPLTEGVHHVTVEAHDMIASTTTASFSFDYLPLDAARQPEMTTFDVPDRPQRTCVTVSTSWRDPQTRVERLRLFDPDVYQAIEERVAPGEWQPRTPDPGLQLQHEFCPTRGSGTYHYTLLAFTMLHTITHEFAIEFDLDAPSVAAPTVDLVEVDPAHRFGAGITHAVRWQVGDATSGVEATVLQLDGRDVPDVDLERTDHGIAAARASVQVPPGTHELTIRAVDRAGNATERTVTIIGVARPAPVASAAASAGAPNTGGAAALSVSPAHSKNRPASLAVRIVQGRIGELQRTNMLTLRVRASEWSVWRMKIAGTTFLRRAMTTSAWRTVRINLGDVTPIGRRINAAPRGSYIRIPIVLHGTDAMRLTGSPTHVVLIART